LTSTDAPKASVIIPTYNGGALFHRVLCAVQAQHTSWPFEIIVVDSESDDGTVEFAKSKNIVVHSIPKREFQHGRTRNLGIGMAAGEYAALLTQDALPADNLWLQNLVTVMDKYPRAAGAFGRHVAYPDASPFLARDIANHFASFDAYPLAVSKYTSFRRWTSGDIGWRQMVHYFSDNNACLRRAAWKKIPYPHVDYGEDQAWAARVIEAGFEKLYVKSAVVYHSHEYSPDEMFERSRIEGHFFKKYFGYDIAPAEDPLDKHIAGLNAKDEKWAAQKGIDDKWLALQRALNEAKIRGLWKGMRSASQL